jgi:hypothetical protein
MFTLQTSVQTTFARGGRGGGGEKNLLAEVTVNSKEENS